MSGRGVVVSHTTMPTLAWLENHEVDAPDDEDESSIDGQCKLFVELYELDSTSQGRAPQEWQETARWIKYEEDAVGADHHWGRPHVAFLTFHSLTLLRRCIGKGIVILDSESQNFFQVCHEVAEKFFADVRKDQERQERVHELLQLLLCSHTHGHDKNFGRILSTVQSNIRENSRKISSILSHSRLHVHGTQPQATGSMSRPTSPQKSNSGFETQRVSRTSETSARSSEKEAPRFVIGDDIEEETEDEDEDEDVENGEVTREKAAPQRKSAESLYSNSVRNSTAALPESKQPARKKSSVVSFMQYLATARKQSAIGEAVIGTSAPDLKNRKSSYDELMKRMPDGAESAQVFAGIFPKYRRLKFAFVRLKSATHMPELQGAPIGIRFLIFILGAKLPDVNLHEIGRSMSTLMANAHFHAPAYTATNKRELLRAVDDVLDGGIFIPPVQIDSRSLLPVSDLQKALKMRMERKQQARKDTQAKLSASYRKFTTVSYRSQKSTEKSEKRQPSQNYDPLKRTGIPFYGFVQDFKRRFPLYLSDITDACHWQCIMTVVFMFLTAVAPSIAFGGLLGQRTTDFLGIIETLVAQCVCGIIWSLFACEPLLFLAATGPLLLFEESLFVFCGIIDVPFLQLRVWVGFWLVVIGIITIAFEGPFLIRSVTRFTEDVFATLISVIFIYEAVKFVFKNFTKYHPVVSVESYCTDFFEKNIYTGNMSMGHFTIVPNCSARNCSTSRQPGAMGDYPALERDQPDTSLLTCGLVLTTFIVAYLFNQLRSSHLFSRRIRRAIGDFGVPVAIIMVVMLDVTVFDDAYLQKVHMQDHFNLTNYSGRNGSWFVDPFNFDRMPAWAPFFALVPACLVFTLIFSEVELTEMLLTQPVFKLRKGSGFHWDFLLSCLLTFFCTLFGLPIMCSSSVQSIEHVSGLVVMKKHAPGERPKVDYVIEQRMTGLVLALLTGGCAFVGHVIKETPDAVLFGFFLYLGVINLANVQLVNRVFLMIVPSKYYPPYAYCQQVAQKKMHVYTVIQLLCLGFVQLLKTFKKTTIFFPLAFLLIVLIRTYLLPFLFNDEDLEALDGHENDRQLNIDEDPDFYEMAHGII